MYWSNKKTWMKWLMWEIGWSFVVAELLNLTELLNRMLNFCSAPERKKKSQALENKMEHFSQISYGQCILSSSPLHKEKCSDSFFFLGHLRERVVMWAFLDRIEIIAESGPRKRKANEKKKSVCVCASYRKVLLYSLNTTEHNILYCAAGVRVLIKLLYFPCSHQRQTETRK